MTIDLIRNRFTGQPSQVIETKTALIINGLPYDKRSLSQTMRKEMLATNNSPYAPAVYQYFPIRWTDVEHIGAPTSGPAYNNSGAVPYWTRLIGFEKPGICMMTDLVVDSIDFEHEYTICGKYWIRYNKNTDTAESLLMTTNGETAITENIIEYAKLFEDREEIYFVGMSSANYYRTISFAINKKTGVFRALVNISSYGYRPAICTLLRRDDNARVYDMAILNVNAARFDYVQVTFNSDTKALVVTSFGNYAFAGNYDVPNPTELDSDSISLTLWPHENKLTAHQLVGNKWSVVGTSTFTQLGITQFLQEKYPEIVATDTNIAGLVHAYNSRLVDTTINGVWSQLKVDTYWLGDKDYLLLSRSNRMGFYNNTDDEHLYGWIIILKRNKDVNLVTDSTFTEGAFTPVLHLPHDEIPGLERADRTGGFWKISENRFLLTTNFGYIIMTWDAESESFTYQTFRNCEVKAVGIDSVGRFYHSFMNRQEIEVLTDKTTAGITLEYEDGSGVIDYSDDVTKKNIIVRTTNMFGQPQAGNFVLHLAGSGSFADGKKKYYGTTSENGISIIEVLIESGGSIQVAASTESNDGIVL